MSFLARFGLGLCGLSLVAAPAVRAQAPASPYPANQPAAAQAAGHHHKGLFGYRHCVECQRAYAKAHDGVDVPPPPVDPAAGYDPWSRGLPARRCRPGTGGLPAGAVAPGAAVYQHGAAANGVARPARPAKSSSGRSRTSTRAPPGHAVVGGPVLMADAPGHAVVGGAGAGDAGL